MDKAAFALTTNITWDGMSDSQELANTLLSPVRYFFRGTDVTIIESQDAGYVTLVHASYLCSHSLLKSIAMGAALVFSLILGGLVKLYASYTTPIEPKLAAAIHHDVDFYEKNGSFSTTTSRDGEGNTIIGNLWDIDFASRSVGLGSVSEPSSSGSSSPSLSELSEIDAEIFDEIALY